MSSHIILYKKNCCDTSAKYKPFDKMLMPS